MYEMPWHVDCLPTCIFYFILLVLIIEDLKRWKAEGKSYENFLLLLSGLRMEAQYLPK